MNPVSLTAQTARNSLKPILAGVLLSLSLSVSANMEDIVSANTQIGAQFITTNVDYTETSLQGVKADTESGFVPGYGISLSIMKNLLFGNDYLSFQFSQLNGVTDYVGSSGSVPTILGPTQGAYGSLRQTDGAKLVDFSGRMGKGFELSDAVLLTPYVEFGHHNWKRHLDASVPTFAIAPAALASVENYNNFYYAFGTMLQIAPVNKLVITANAMIGSTFSPTMASSGPNLALGGIGPTAIGTLRLGSSVIYKVGLALDYAFYENFHVNAGAEYVGFDYGNSAMAGATQSFYEPFSQTNYTTVRAGFGYAF